MNINLHNYETWFHQYVDGELDQSQMAAVEAFTQKHPDLETELEQLMQTIIDAPTIAMPNKHLLLKPEQWDAEKLEPWQEKLLLRLDNEGHNHQSLTAAEAQEWQWLQASRLPTESLAMPNKENLYSHNRRKPLVVPMHWVRRVAVAAAVVGLVWAFWPEQTVDAPSQEMAVVTDTPELPNAANINDNAVSPEANVDNANALPGVNVTAPDAIQTTALRKPKSVDAKDAAAPTTKENTPVNYSNVGQLAVVHTVPDETNTTIDGIKRPTIDVNGMGTEPAIIAAVQGSPNPATEFAIDEQYLGADDEDEFVNISGIKIKRSKIRGMLRSVSRNVTRRTSTENIQETIFPR